MGKDKGVKDGGGLDWVLDGVSHWNLRERDEMGLTSMEGVYARARTHAHTHTTYTEIKQQPKTPHLLLIDTLYHHPA